MTRLQEGRRCDRGAPKVCANAILRRSILKEVIRAGAEALRPSSSHSSTENLQKSKYDTKLCLSAMSDWGLWRTGGGLACTVPSRGAWLVEFCRRFWAWACRLSSLDPWAQGGTERTGGGGGGSRGRGKDRRDGGRSGAGGR